MKWTIAFDATLNVVEIDAETEGEAIEFAEKAILGLEESVNEYLNRERVQFDFAITDIHLIKSEDTGEEFIK